MLFSLWSYIPHTPASPCPLATNNLFFISIILSFQECYISAIIQYMTFWEWLFYSSWYPWGPSNLCVSLLYFFALNSTISCYGWLVSSLTQLQDIWVASSFGLLQIKLLKIFAYKFPCQHSFSFLCDKCPRVHLLGPMIHVCLTSLLPPDSSWVAVLIRIPIGHV